MLLTCPILNHPLRACNSYRVTEPIKPEHHVQHWWWKAKFHALHRLFHASPGETPTRGSCLGFLRFAPAFDGIATIWLPKSPIIREQSEQILCGIMWNSNSSMPHPPWGCNQSVSMHGRKATSPLQETNTAAISTWMDSVCGSFPPRLCWDRGWPGSARLASRLVQPKQKATTPTPKLRQLCPGSPPVSDPMIPASGTSVCFLACGPLDCARYAAQICPVAVQFLNPALVGY